MTCHCTYSHHTDTLLRPANAIKVAYNTHPSCLSDLTLIYCGKAAFGHFSSSFLLNRTTIYLKRAQKLPQNGLSLATIGQARQAARMQRTGKRIAALTHKVLQRIRKMQKKDKKKPLRKVAERTGLEPATPCVTGRYSNQLNYRSVMVGEEGFEPPTLCL